ncbi:hypothetical protein OGAPHI_006909 [Ogataea philodendri]|uniref:DNA polymerase alpha subunit B n=1 Tax=Ogataea philodendri TaxID=1378263 RepID=A0A9P8NTZ6_9ASCO|nr:uncharacterized protein OGAPHI_006909 [Ogataea philodendri]KAH3660323.1 hypothetical protein OGAPHI_006909 [Ogataea philodendri]
MTSETVRVRFNLKSDDSDTVSKCEELMAIFGLNAEDLFVQWETFVMNSSVADDPLQLSVANLGRLQEHLQKKLVKSQQKTPLSAVKRPMLRTPNMNLIPSTPSSKKHRPNGPRSADTSMTSITSSPLASSPAKDVTSGEIIETLNGHLELKPGSSTKPKLLANFNPQKYKFRTMNQKLLEAADYLDEQIDSMAKILLEHYKFDSDEFGNPNIQSQSEILTVGRVVPDSPLTASDADLNSSSLFLETSRLGGIGQRVKLDVSSLENYSFFPGQIVCLRGQNLTGEFFKATQIYAIPFLGSPVSSSEELQSYEYGNDYLKVLVTAGPYTPQKELDYSHLAQFVERVNTEVRPDTLVMFGPFVDVNHVQIADGSARFDGLDKQPATLDDIFNMVVAPILRKLECLVILVPSTRDATTKHAAYPQDSFDRKSLGLGKNFKCFPNPATFQLNEFLVGCSNNDIFKDLKDVVAGSARKESRFDRIANHVIEQRRYYPVFPGGLRQKRSLKEQDESAHISGADLHLSYLGLAEFNTSLPDVLILPSELKSFSKIVQNVLVINPGTFMRQNSAGTYCEVNFKAPVLEELEKAGDDSYLHTVWKRARVDVRLGGLRWLFLVSLKQSCNGLFFLEAFWRSLREVFADDGLAKERDGLHEKNTNNNKWKNQVPIGLDGRLRNRSNNISAVVHQSDGRRRNSSNKNKNLEESSPWVDIFCSLWHWGSGEFQQLEVIGLGLDKLDYQRDDRTQRRDRTKQSKESELNHQLPELVVNRELW